MSLANRDGHPPSPLSLIGYREHSGSTDESYRYDAGCHRRRVALVAALNSSYSGRVEPFGSDHGSTFLPAARRLYRSRRLREQIFGIGLFADPAWDILLDLFIAKQEAKQAPITGACLAATVPTSTALRHIAHLIEMGLAERCPHPGDSRSAHLNLTARGENLMIAYFIRTKATRDSVPA